MKDKSRKLWVVLFAIGLIFAGGVAVGQNLPHPYLREYSTPADYTELERQLQAIEIEEIKGALQSLQENYAANQQGVPAFSVNPKTGEIQALISEVLPKIQTGR